MFARVQRFRITTVTRSFPIRSSLLPRSASFCRNSTSAPSTLTIAHLQPTRELKDQQLLSPVSHSYVEFGGRLQHLGGIQSGIDVKRFHFHGGCRSGRINHPVFSHFPSFGAGNAIHIEVEIFPEALSRATLN